MMWISTSRLWLD